MNSFGMKRKGWGKTSLRGIKFYCYRKKYMEGDFRTDKESSLGGVLGRMME